nr:MAG TPA: hypothetical protein [Caudoviricetes sp.]
MEIIKTLAECFGVQCFFWLIGGTMNYLRTGKFFITRYNIGRNDEKSKEIYSKSWWDKR